MHFPDIRMNASGTCLVQFPLRTNEWMLNSWVKGALRTLSIPSTYQVFDILSRLNMFSVANMRCRHPSTFRSDCKKPAGKWSSFISKSKSNGSAGRFFCWWRFAALARYLDSSMHSSLYSHSEMPVLHVLCCHEQQPSH